MKIENLPTIVQKQLSANSTADQTDDTFDKMLAPVLDMNSNQVKANTEIQDVLTGKSDDSTGALMDLEKANLQMQLFTTIRDKALQGYQQIVNMQI